MNARALLSRSYLAAAVAAALFLPARPADAAIAGAFVGSGNINPGIMATASFQQIHIAGQLNCVSTGARADWRPRSCSLRRAPAP